MDVVLDFLDSIKPLLLVLLTALITLLGKLVFSRVQKWKTRKNEASAIRVETVHDRIQAHQEAHRLAKALRFSSIKPDISDLDKEARGFFDNKSLYLTERSRRAFAKCRRLALLHNQLMGPAGGMGDDKAARWDEMRECAEIIASEAELPSFKVDEPD